MYVCTTPQASCCPFAVPLLTPLLAHIPTKPWTSHTQVQLSVVDNALVVHHPATAVAVLFDVALQQHKPLANPLPLRRLQLLPPDLAAAAAASAAAADLEQQHQQHQQVVTTSSTGDELSSSSDAASSSSAGGGNAPDGSSTADMPSRGGSFSSLSRTRAGFRRTLITVPAAANNTNNSGSSSNSLPLGAAAGGAVGAAVGASAPGAVVGGVYESSEVLEEAGWVFSPPNIILDKADKAVGRLQMDLQVIALWCVCVCVVLCVHTCVVCVCIFVCMCV